MHSGAKVRVTSMSSKLEFGSEHIVNETCAVLDSMVVFGDERIHKISEVKPVAELVPRPGEFWVTRCGRIVLVATVDSDYLMVVDKEFLNSTCSLVMYYVDGSFSSVPSERDLICPIRGEHVVGSMYGVCFREAVPC